MSRSREENATSASLRAHYSADHLLESIFGALVQAGKNPARITLDDLAAIDHFHTRGRESTRELAELAKPQADEMVLDLGCGLGGAARYLCDRFSCRVFGVDLSPDYVAAANQLNRLVGLNDRVQIQQASVLDLPFPNDQFDLVWTEHVSMNVENKSEFYKQITRVLKPGGRLVFHDVFACDGPGEKKTRIAPIFPLPWAGNSEISFLATESETRVHLQRAGLDLTTWQDKLQQTAVAFRKAVQKLDGNPEPTGVGLHLLMGSDFRTKIQNYLLGLSNGSITTAMGLAFRPGSR